MASANSFLEWKQTRPGLLISAVVEAGLAYGFGSWAIDSGSPWAYLLAIIFAAGTIVSLVKAIKPHGQSQ